MIRNKIEDIYYWILGFFERVKRSYDFAKFGWDNYDFDSAYLWYLMSFKLKRILHSLETSNIGIHEKEDIDALKESIILCDRIFSEKYNIPYLDEHDKKWGELECDYRSNNGDHTTVIMSRKGVKTDKDKEQERKEFLLAYDKAEKDRCDDIDKLALIFKVYLPRWWD